MTLDPDKEPEMAGRWYSATIQRFTANKKSALVKFDDLLEEDEISALVEEHHVDRIRPKPPGHQPDHAEWVSSLTVCEAVEVFWEEAFWPSHITAVLGRPTEEEARRKAAAATSAMEHEDPGSELWDLAKKDAALFTAAAEEVLRQEIDKEARQSLFQICAVG